MAGTWGCELTDWQRAGFRDTENAPHSNLDSLRMKLTHLELEYLKDASQDVLSPTTHMFPDHLVEYRRQLLTSTTNTSSEPSHATRELSSGLKLENIVQLDAIKRYKERADAEAVKFKSELFPNTNPATIDGDPKDVHSPRSPELIPDHHRAKTTPQASSSGYNKATPTRSHGVFSSGRAPWKSQQLPQRKRHRPDDDDCVVINDTEQYNKDSTTEFVTARDQYIINQQKKGCGQYDRTRQQINTGSYGGNKRSLGARRNMGNKFIPPVKGDEDDNRAGLMRAGGGCGVGNSASKLPPELEGDERLRNIEPRMVEMIMNEIMDHSSPVHWDDIAGLQFAKNTIKEIVVFPLLRPDIFTGLRGPPKGILLFGPPGTGKTLIGKCIASQAGATFFSISASSLTSKWIGEGEKMVRALFAVARCYEPAVIFIDEIDSLLSQRSDTEHEASRRMKTEFLIKLDGVTVATSDRILLVGATNRPQEIDEAARRRLVKRLYIPLPDAAARKQIVKNLMQQQLHNLSDNDIDNISQQTDGYSGADVATLCSEAAMGPIRSISVEQIKHISTDQVRPVVYQDFTEALLAVRPSVSVKDLEVYEEWNKLYGCGR